jgi:nucleoid-associated protein YgaU
MRTDVKIGIVVGLLLAIAFVVYVIATAGPKETEGEPLAGKQPRDERGLDTSDRSGGGSPGATLGDTSRGKGTGPGQTFDQDTGHVAEDTRDAGGTVLLGYDRSMTEGSSARAGTGRDEDAARESAKGPPELGVLEKGPPVTGGGIVDETTDVAERTGIIGAEEATEAAKSLPPDVTGWRNYEVKPGDTLGAISELMYGSSRHWTLIAKENPHASEFSLRVGMRLRIPPLPSPAAETGKPAAPSVEGKLPAGHTAYKVEKGDSFRAIARKLYGAEKYWYRIAKANPDARERALMVGSVLRIPPAPQPTATENETRTRPLPTGWTTYKVKEGDTLSGISLNVYNTTRYWTEIAKANPDANEMSLRVGQELRIPPRPKAASRPGGRRPGARPPRRPLPEETEFPRPDFGP